MTTGGSPKPWCPGTFLTPYRTTASSSLDELTEFQRHAIEGLCQPLEDGHVGRDPEGPARPSLQLQRITAAVPLAPDVHFRR